MDPGPFAVDGLTVTADATISVHVIEPRGDGAGACLWYYPTYDCESVSALLVRTAGGPTRSAKVHLYLTEGTRNDGTWTGVWHIGATRAGTWTLTDVAWLYGDSPWQHVDPRVAPGVTATVRVDATHVPTVGVTRIPALVPYGARQWVQYTYRDGDGRPLAHWPVAYGSNRSGEHCSEGERTITTDSLGRITLRIYYLTASPVAECLYLTVPVLDRSHRLDDVALLAMHDVVPYLYYRTVGLRTSASSVRVGSSLTVVGTAGPHLGTLRFQRWVGGTWRTLATRPVSPRTGRATFLWRGTRAGVVLLRVVAYGGPPVQSWGDGPAGQSWYGATPSRTARVTVVR